MVKGFISVSHVHAALTVLAKRCVYTQAQTVHFPISEKKRPVHTIWSAAFCLLFVFALWYQGL